MIVNAKFCSMWNRSEQLVETKCKVNMETKEVFDIEPSEYPVNGELDDEYILIDGVGYDVYNDVLCDVPEGEFWYHGDDWEEGGWD